MKPNWWKICTAGSLVRTEQALFWLPSFSGNVCRGGQSKFRNRYDITNKNSCLQFFLCGWKHFLQFWACLAFFPGNPRVGCWFFFEEKKEARDEERHIKESHFSGSGAANGGRGTEQLSQIRNDAAAVAVFPEKKDRKYFGQSLLTLQYFPYMTAEIIIIGRMVNHSWFSGKRGNQIMWENWLGE